MKPTIMKLYELSKRKLSISLQNFEGFIFYDQYNNFYNIFEKTIHFHNNGPIFVGDKDKEAFSLFDNYADIEKKIKDKINEIKKYENKNKKNEIENEIIEELKNKLENFDLNKVILKNGKYYYDVNSRKRGDYNYIHENSVKVYQNNTKEISSDFFQEIKNNIIYIRRHGEYQHFLKNYEGKCFMILE